MEDDRLIEREDDEEEEEEAHEEGEEGGELIPVERITPRGISSEDEDYEDEEDYEEEEEGELIPVERIIGISSEDEDYEEEEYYEDEEADELIPAEMTSPSVSTSIADSRTFLGEALINDGVLDDSNDGGKEELIRGEIDGLFCPICYEAWTNGGDHRICCLPCGHIYGFSCIKKWLQGRRASGRCPQCNGLCTLKDVRVLYTKRLCAADVDLQKRVGILEAKCAYLDEKAMHAEHGAKHTALLEEINGKHTDILARITSMQQQQTEMKEQQTEMHRMLTDIHKFHIQNHPPCDDININNLIHTNLTELVFLHRIYGDRDLNPSGGFFELLMLI
ncbi:unnamed protein product [Lactuca virosa]|uniref:RING-type domain-containing protein n=1 Tax=Lactuca virosa TaxID=75947 RepID=A0AAU9MFM4_9ASTR|nr:unnamed protein product [Lactuca virosa]